MNLVHLNGWLGPPTIKFLEYVECLGLIELKARLDKIDCVCIKLFLIKFREGNMSSLRDHCHPVWYCELKMLYKRWVMLACGVLIDWGLTN